MRKKKYQKLKYPIVGSILGAIEDRSGFTGKELADELGLSQQLYSHHKLNNNLPLFCLPYIKETTRLSYEELVKIVESLFRR